MRKPDHIYVAESSLGLIKIGMSHDPEKRLNDLSKVVGLDIKLLLKVYVGEEYANKVERGLHKRFESQRLHGEWFSPCIKGSISNLI